MTFTLTKRLVGDTKMAAFIYLVFPVAVQPQVLRYNLLLFRDNAMCLNGTGFYDKEIWGFVDLYRQLFGLEKLLLPSWLGFC